MLRDLQVSNLVHFSSSFVYADPSRCLLRAGVTTPVPTFQEAFPYPSSASPSTGNQPSESSIQHSYGSLFAFPVTFPFCQSYSAILAAQMTALRHAKLVSQMLVSVHQQLCVRSLSFALKHNIFEHLPRSNRCNHLVPADSLTGRSLDHSRIQSRSQSQSRAAADVPGPVATAPVTTDSPQLAAAHLNSQKMEKSHRTPQSTSSTQTPNLTSQLNDTIPPAVSLLHAQNASSDQSIREAFVAQTSIAASIFASPLHDQVLEVTRILSPTHESKHYRFTVIILAQFLVTQFYCVSLF